MEGVVNVYALRICGFNAIVHIDWENVKTETQFYIMFVLNRINAPNTFTDVAIFSQFYNSPHISAKRTEKILPKSNIEHEIVSICFMGRMIC